MASFAGIIKIVTIFIKTIFKDSIKVKRIGNYVSTCNLYMYSMIWQNRYNCAKFRYCRICVTDVRDPLPNLFGSPIREHPRKIPSWIRLIKCFPLNFLKFLIAVSNLLFVFGVIVKELAGHRNISKFCIRQNLRFYPVETLYYIAGHMSCCC